MDIMKRYETETLYKHRTNMKHINQKILTEH